MRVPHLLALPVVAVICGSVSAQTWTAGNGLWTTGTNWSSGAVPAGTATIDNGGTAIIDGAAPNLSAQLRIGFAAGTTGAVDFNMPGSSLTVAGDIRQGENGNGDLIIQGGNLTANRYVAARFGTGTTTTTQTGGNVTINNRLFLGHDSTSVWTATGGTISIGALAELGVQANGSGTLDLGGTVVYTGFNTVVAGRDNGTRYPNTRGNVIARDQAVVDLTGVLRIGEEGIGTLTVSDTADVDVSGDLRAGEFGDGTVTISGGTLDVGRLVTARELNSSATVIQSGGTFTTSTDAWIAFQDDASFTGTGGTFNVGTDLTISENFNGNPANGTVTLSGTHVTNVGADIRMGDQAAGSTALLDVSGGADVNVTNRLLVGINGDSQLTQSGGTISADSLSIDINAMGGTSDSYDHTGGTSDFNTGLVGASATANLDTTEDLNVGRGIQSGEVNFLNSLTVRGGTATSQANLEVGGGGTVIINNDFNVGNGDPTGGATTGNLNVLGSAQVDGTLTASGVTTIAGGQVLSGSGTVNTTNTLVTGGTLGPGDHLYGNDFDRELEINTTGATGLTLDSGSIWSVDFQGPTDTDLVDLDGPLFLTDVALAPNLRTYGGAPAAPGNIGATSGANGDFHWILDNDGGDAITGTFSNTFSSPFFTALYPNATQFVSLGQPYAIFYDANFDAGTLTGGNDILLVAIPEPSRACLLGLGLAALVLRRRRS